ncbi:MAG: hypothetical protein IAX21_01895 [Candidatus Bathyarchaeota archaeon]|nr:MAG: hypothetical protein IAX21_01895 [Candidatus Bathyarchaeota archaeon]
MSEFEIKPLKEKPVIAKHLSKNTLADKIIRNFLNLNVKYAEIQLTGKRDSGNVGKGIGRVLKTRYMDDVEYLGSDSSNKTLYLERISPLDIKNPEIPGNKEVVLKRVNYS